MERIMDHRYSKQQWSSMRRKVVPVKGTSYPSTAVPYSTTGLPQSIVTVTIVRRRMKNQSNYLLEFHSDQNQAYCMYDMTP